MIGAIFFAAMLAPLSRSDSAWGSERTTGVEEHALTIREQIVGTWRLESIYEEDAGGERLTSSESLQQACSWPTRMAIFPFRL